MSYNIMVNQNRNTININLKVYCILIFLTICVFLIWRRRNLYWVSWQLPGPLALPFIGNGLIYVAAGTTNFLHLIPWCIKTYGKNKLVRVWLGGELTIMVADATAAWQINKLTLVKGASEHLAQPLVRKGIFVNRNIPHWKASRKIVAQIFHFKVLKHFIPIFHDETLVLMEKLQKYSLSGESFYPPKLMELATFNTILRNTLGVNLHVQCEDSHPVVQAMHHLFEHFQWKAIVPIFKNDFIYTLIGRRQAELRDLKTLDLFAQSILKNIKQSADSIPRQSLIDLLTQHPDISEEEIKAQILTIVLAGTDTSMFSNSVMLLVLAVLPDIQHKVYYELVQILGSDSYTCPSYEDLMKLDYTDRFIKEVLRMFPASYYVAKESTQDMKITTDDKKEYTFPAGIGFTLLISEIHRSPEYYENPLVFDPDRWLPEQVATRHPFCFLPFSNGPRNCIAGKYALLQMKAVVATLLRRYEFLPSASFKSIEEVKLKLRLTMSVRKQCRIRLRLRAQV